MATFPDLCTGTHRAPHICTRTYQYKAIMSPVKGDEGQIWGTTDEALKSRMGMRLLELEWKLKDVAERTGYGYKNVQRWISGKTQVPGAFVAAFAAHVPVNPRWLLTGEGGRDDTVAGTVDLGMVELQISLATEALRLGMNGPGDIRTFAGMALEVLDSLGLPPLKLSEAIRGLLPAESPTQTTVDPTEEVHPNVVVSPEGLAATGRSIDEIRDVLAMMGVSREVEARMIQAVTNIRRRRDSAG